MKLFVDSEVLRCQMVTIYEKSGRSIIKITYSTPKGHYKIYEISLPIESNFFTKKQTNCKLITKLKTQTSENGITFYRDKKQKDSAMYALLSSKGTEVFGDLYIHKTHKERIKIVKVMGYADYSNDLKSHETRIYLIKINTNNGDFIPFYKNGEKPETLKQCFMFFKPKGESAQAEVTKNNTIIQTLDYIPLSEFIQ